MSQKGLLSPLIVKKWRETGNEDPVSAAREALKSVRLFLLFGIIAAIGMFLLIAQAIYGYWVIDPGASFAAFFFLFVMTLWCLTWTGKKSQSFAYGVDGFGRNFSDLCRYLEKTLEELVVLEESVLKAMATTILKEGAAEVRTAERRDAQYFEVVGSSKGSMAHDSARRKARNLFSEQFETFKRFGLTDPKGWTPYFVTDEEAQAPA